MTAGATITATLTDRATGGPAQGCVQPVDGTKALPDTGFRHWCTEAGGNTLRIGPLAPGTYQLIADPELDTLGLQWVGATGGTGSRGATQRITVASGAVVAAPAIAFDRGGTGPGPPDRRRRADGRAGRVPANVNRDATFTVANIPPQQVKLFYLTPDGRTGWVGGTDLAGAWTYRIRNDRTTTIAVTIPVS